MPKRAQKAQPPDTKGKRIAFDIETWQGLDLLARERMMTFQELADEAFRDVLKKYGRPYDVRDALKKSARAADLEAEGAEKAPVRAKPATAKSATAKRATAKRRQAPKSKRPTGG